MAFNYDEQHEHTTNAPTTTRNSTNFDAPLIGDLKLANNNNDANTMNTPIIYNDEPDADPLHHSLDNNQFYDHDDTMSPFGMTIDTNIYGSPSLGFDHLTAPMPTILNLDTSPLPPPPVTTFDPNATTSNTTEDITSTDTNHNNAHSNAPPPITPSFDDTSDPSSLLNFEHMDMEHDTYYHSYNDDTPMFDTIRSCFSSRSEFGIDPVDQSTINVVSDGISQFLTPNSSYNEGPISNTPNANSNPSASYPVIHAAPSTAANNYPMIHSNPFGTPPSHRTIHHHIANNMIPMTTTNANNNIISTQSTSLNTSGSSSSSASSSASSSSSSSSSSASSSSSSSSLSSSSSSSSLTSSMEMECDIDMTPNTEAPPSYQMIKHNVFVSRKRKSYKDGYQYKCDCHYTANGDDCDKNSCFNKLFYYECVSALSCSVEDETGDASFCSNRKFQRGEWKKVRVQNAGRKGWGLFADEDIECGQFVIEYVGEVIDDKECTKRLTSDYLNRNKFYLLKLEGGKKGESIDATVKGGAARFMNHSCEPNCKAQKWTVGGELCLGFFADTDIKKGEELTFDYQFQRYGCVKQKCYCGSANCRKYLGASTNYKSPNRNRKPSPNTMKHKKRTYRKNKKIVKRNMDERIVVKQWYDDLMKLSDINDANDALEEDHVTNKCIAKGRLLRRQYINTIANGLLDEFKNGTIDFDEMIRKYDDDEEEDIDFHDMKWHNFILREPKHDDALLHIAAIDEFEKVIAKQYEIGCDFELEHLNKMKRIHNVMQLKEQDTLLCNEHNKCSVCIMYGVGSCRMNSIHAASHSMHDIQQTLCTMNDIGNDVVKKKYLKFKQESERKVMEHKIKNRDNNKKKKKSKSKKKEKKQKIQQQNMDNVHENNMYHDKDQSDADSQYAADLHEQLNKPHLRSRRTRSCSKLQGESPPIKSVNHHNSENMMSGIGKIKNVQIQSKNKHKTKINSVQSVMNLQHETNRSAIIKSHKSPLKNGMMNTKQSTYAMTKRNNDDTKMKQHKKIKKKNIETDKDIEDVNDIEFCDKCGISKDSLKSKGTWSRHLHSKHTYYCKQCALQFTTALTLSDHEKATHREKKTKYKWAKGKQKTSKTSKKSTKSEKNVDKDELPNTCIKCGRPRGETPKSHWNKHIQTDHRFPCPHCQYRFAHRKKFNEHLKELHSKNNKKIIEAENGANEVEDVEMIGADTLNINNIDKKRKYSQYNATEQQQPRKRRKLATDGDNDTTDEDMFKNDEYIKTLIEERDRELKLFAFVDFEGYQEDEELMVSIYNKIDKNDAKYAKVFKKEESLNKDILNVIQSLTHPEHSVFNSLIFSAQNNSTTQPQAAAASSSAMNILPTAQPIIISNKKINNAHFSCAASNMKMSAKATHSKPAAPNNRYAGYNSHKHHHSHSHHHHHHASNTSTPNSSHTPISHTSPTSSRSNSHCSNNNTAAADRSNRNNHYHHNSYHHTHHKQDHHHHSHPHHHHPHRHQSHHIRYNNSSYTRHNAPNYKQDPENKTLFIDNIPIGCTEDALLNALKKTGSIKSILLRTKLNQQSQYANVVCFQKHICESLIDAGKRPIPLQLPSGQIVQQRLSIHYHNQKKVDMAKEKRRKEMAATREQRIKNQ